MLFKHRRVARSLYHIIILAVALTLVVASVTDGVLHVIEFVSMDGAPSPETMSAVSLQVLSPFVAAIILLLLLGRDWGAAVRAEEKAAAADERAALALRRLDEAIETIDQGFALFDADDRLVRCNSRYREMYPRSAPFTPGTPFEELVRRSAVRGTYADCNPAAPDEWIAERLRVHRDGGGPVEQLLSDGRWLRVDERRTADGGNVGLRTDITELKRRQSDLAAKTAVLEATLGAMVQGVLVWNADRRLIAHNHRVKMLLDLPEGLLRPTTTLDAFLVYLIERGEFGPGDVRTLLKERLQKLDLVNGGCQERRRPNGRVMEVRTIPVVGGLTLITYIDVTEQREAEASLRESEERFRKLSDSAMEGILAHENGVIIDANRAAGELLRMPAEDMIGRHLNDFIAPQLHGAVLVRLERREESRIELPCVRRDGVAITVEAQNRYVQHRGRLVSMVSFRDITEQRRAEDLLRRAKEEAEQASRSKNDFVRTISHELRTPMNGVLGMLELLHEGDLPEPLRAFAATAYASAEAMMGLLDDLLDFSKIEAGRLSLGNVLFDAAEIITVAAEVVAARAAAKNLSLAVCAPADLDCRMVADPVRLRQVLLNLVGNAIKFTDRGGVSITITADHVATVDGITAPALRFDVRDSGVGITPEAQEKLFRDFVQVHEGAASAGGTGLGLAISRRLVELMGGRIGVDSARGAGSRFWFVLPVGHVEEAANPMVGSTTAAIAPAVGARAQLAGAAVAVIDPAPVTRLALARQIAGWGADVTPCATMEEAQAALGDDSGRLKALVSGAGIPGSGAPPKGAAVAALHWGDQWRCLIIRPLGASIPPNHPQTTALEWPAGPQALWPALAGQAPRPAIAAPSRTTAPPPPLTTPLGRLLVAEDGETNRMVAAAFLERAGYEITFAVNGREAVEAMEGMSYDLVLMDIGMPEMDGFEATKRIRALPPPAGETPIIALTADASEDDRRRCLAAGMNDHVAKPLERTQLLAAVTRWTPVPDDGRGGGGRGESSNEQAPPAAFEMSQPAADPAPPDALDSVTLAQLECDLDPDILNGLIRQFLDEAAARVERIVSADADSAMVRREAHTLKSTAGTFGARLLSAAARELEAACDSGVPPSPEQRARLPQLLQDAALAYRSGGRLG